MKNKLLCCALLAGMGMSGSVMAQDYDDRFYVTAGVGYAWFDNGRNVGDDMYGQIGFGKFITPNISLDAELWHSNPELDQFENVERNWELMSLSVVGRYHFISPGRNWNPYIALGIGGTEHHDGTQTQPIAFGFNESRNGTNLSGLLGFGMQTDLGYASLRGELGVRMDMDDEGLDGDDSYYDGYAGISFLFPIGPEAVAAAPVVVAPQKTCADLDDDGDGVNNCDDKCPGSVAGQGVGADGCPVPAPEPEPVPEPKPFRG